MKKINELLVVSYNFDGNIHRIFRESNIEDAIRRAYIETTYPPVLNICSASIIVKNSDDEYEEITKISSEQAAWLVGHDDSWDIVMTAWQAVIVEKIWEMN